MALYPACFPRYSLLSHNDSIQIMRKDQRSVYSPVVRRLQREITARFLRVRWDGQAWQWRPGGRRTASLPAASTRTARRPTRTSTWNATGSVALAVAVGRSSSGRSPRRSSPGSRSGRSRSIVGLRRTTGPQSSLLRGSRLSTPSTANFNGNEFTCSRSFKNRHPAE